MEIPLYWVESVGVAMDRKRLLAIGLAAQRLCVSPSMLRVYADKGDVPSGRLPSGHRRFGPDGIERIASRRRGEDGGEREGKGS